MERKIAIVGLGCPTEVGFERTNQICSVTAEMLAEKGIYAVNTGIIMEDTQTAALAVERVKELCCDVILVCISTWSEDNYLLQLVGSVSKPFILHAFPHMESGSLCGMMQITSVMSDVSVSNYRTVYADPGSEKSLIGIRKALGDLEKDKVFAVDPLPQKTIAIGAIGGRVLGMTEIAYDEFSLFQHCGAIIVPISEVELLENVDNADETAVNAELELLLNRGFVIRSSEEALKESLRYYLAMKKLIEKYHLSGLAVKCYTRYMGKVCLGYSLLADEGYACSCEGDVTSAVMMHILQNITGECINHTDILNPEIETNTIIFAHCGSSGFSIAPGPKEVLLVPVRLMETGVCSLFLPKTGTVTAVDLVGHGNQLRMSVMVGEAIEGEMVFPGNQAKIRFDRPVLEICNDVLDKACGHHWMVGYGDAADSLKEYCAKHGIIYQRIA